MRADDIVAEDDGKTIGGLEESEQRQPEPLVYPESCYASCNLVTKNNRGTVKCSLVFICCVIFVQSMIMSGLFSAGLSSIERQFGFSSTKSGGLGSIYEGGFICALPFVTFFGREFPQLKVLAVSIALVGLGEFLCALPHFAAGEYSPTGIDSEELCDGVSVSVLCTTPSSLYGIFVVAVIVLGIGASPVYPLSTAYLESHTDRETFSLYLGIMYGTSAIGPAVGYVASGFLLAQWVTLGDPPAGITDDTDPNWVGAWWVLFVIFAVVAWVISGMLWFYPEAPKYGVDVPVDSTKEPSMLETAGGNSSEEVPPVAVRRTSSIGEVAAAKHFAATVHAEPLAQDEKHVELAPPVTIGQMTKSVLTNVPFMCMALGATFDTFVVSGGSIFLPKVIQSMFSLSAGSASFLLGAILIPAAAAGMLLGGVIMNKIGQKTGRTDSKINAWICLVSSIACTVCCFFLLALCPSEDFAGANVALGTTPISDFSPLGNMQSAACNLQCACDSASVYRPACGSDGTTYFNACLAGCSTETRGADGSILEWSNCACISAGGTLVPDKCEGDCQLLGLYLFGVFLVIFLVFLNDIPGNNYMLRVVKHEEKTYALGMSQLIARLVGSVTAPVIWGAFMDDACLLWDYSCDDGSKNACWEQDGMKTGLRIFFLCFIAKVIGTIFFGIAYVKGKTDN